MDPVIIAGGGQAAMQVADSLRREGYTGPVSLFTEEPTHPYQRPPLSKQYLSGALSGDRLLFRPVEFYAEHDIRVHLDTRVTAVHRDDHSIETSDGQRHRYAKLVLATGSRVRELPVPGADLTGVHYVRTIADADAIAAAMSAAKRVVIIGGGFIGLEVAAVMRAAELAVTVVEMQDRLMARAVAPVMSEYYRGVHEAHGVEIVTGAGVQALTGTGRVEAVRLSDGRELPADIVVVGIGILPNIELAADAGLAIDNGIAVDALARSSDPDILAAGECTSFDSPRYGARLRLESVQNAVDQARTVAATITGKDKPYDAVPWFWSDQYDLKLQMVGISAGHSDVVTRGEMSGGKFSVFYYRGELLLAVDSVNRPADHMLGRKLLAAGISPDRAAAADTSFDLKSLL
ncbi:MAG: FAD-dependent oxidoreductase [Gammaproteobacteria bacterium]|nr:FAD-dependent oxidoreductase [Gammaproteobacteria bacterium]